MKFLEEDSKHGKVFRGKVSVHTKRGRYSIQVFTVVENRGEAGCIRICSTAKNMDRGRSYTRSKTVWIGEGKIKDVEIVFNETGFFSPKDRWKCWSEIKPAG